MSYTLFTFWVADSVCVLQERGNINGQWWAAQLLNALGGSRLWHQTGLRQLSGMLIVVFARTEFEVSRTSSICCSAISPPIAESSESCLFWGFGGYHFLPPLCSKQANSQWFIEAHQCSRASFNLFKSAVLIVPESFIQVWSADSASILQMLHEKK